MRLRLRIAAVLAVLIVLGACSSGSSTESLTVEVDDDTGEIDISVGEDDQTTTTEATPVVVGETGGPTPTGPQPSAGLPDGVEGDGVLVAAVVLATGDIEAALDAGLVTPAEVEAAIQALQDGSLADVVG